MLERNVALYLRMPEDYRQRLNGDILVFLDEKGFEGCGGLEISDEIRLTIAAQACILLQGGIGDYYPSLRTILVYPTAYIAPVRDYEEGGIVTEGEEMRQGEAWAMGSLVLSWDDVRRSARRADGNNLVLHEFAHLIDDELGATENWSGATNNRSYLNWTRTLQGEYDGLIRQIENHRQVLFDRYGATNLAEFFCVATEYFFERPSEVKKRHPKLYEQLRFFYQQDPARLTGAGRVDG